MKARSFITICGIALIALYSACNKDDAPAKNAGRLEALIEEAAIKMSGAVEGPEPGLYPVGAKDQLQLVVDSAETLLRKSSTQYGIDLAEILLQKALTQFDSSVQVAKQIYFDGAGYLDGGAATPFNIPSFTLEAFVYATEFKGGGYIISTEGAANGYKLQCPNGKPTFMVGGTSVAAPANIAQNTWVHLAATFNGTQMKLYVNGTLAAQRAFTYTVTDNGENFRIGEGSRFTSRTFKGRIREVRIWDHVLSDEEVAASMNTAPAGTEPGLLAYWPFNLSAGARIMDRTGQHYVDLINATYADPI